MSLARVGRPPTRAIAGLLDGLERLPYLAEAPHGFLSDLDGVPVLRRRVWFR